MFKVPFVGFSEEALSLLRGRDLILEPVSASDLAKGSVPKVREVPLAIVHWHQGRLSYLQVSKLVRTHYPQAQIILLKDDPAYFDVSPEDDESFDYIFEVNSEVEKASRNGKVCALKPENVTPALLKIIEAVGKSRATATSPAKVIARDVPKHQPSSVQEKREAPTPSTFATTALQDKAPIPQKIQAQPVENKIVVPIQPATNPSGLPSQHANRLCPYPHAEPVEGVNSAVAFSSCFDCNMPVVICEQCGEPNRTAVRCCTTCTASLESVEIEQRFMAALDLNNQPRLSNSINLDEFGAKTIVELLPAMGYLFVRTVGAGVLVFCAYQPQKVLLAIKGDSEPVGMTFILKPYDQEGKPLPPYMLISTQQRIFRVNFLPTLSYAEFEERINLPPNECLRFQPFISSQRLIYFTFNEAQKYTTIWIKELRKNPEQNYGGWKISRDNGYTSAPIQTTGGRIVFYTSNALFVLNPHDLNPQTRMQLVGLKLPVDINNLAVNVAKSNEVIIPSKDSLLRIDPDGAKPVRAKLNVNGSGDFRFGASDDGKQLYIGDAHGITIINAFDGKQAWNLKSTLFIEADCGQAPPRQYGRFLVFIGLTSRGRKIGLLDLHALNKVSWVGEENWYRASPVLCADKLIFASQNSQDQPELKVYQLT